MNNEKEAETLNPTDPVEKPLKVVEGEGSGGEQKVVEKKKIFFFGQAGCLKHSPIKTVTPENHNNHSKAAVASSIDVKETKSDDTKKEVAVPSDDEEDLLKKISEVLGDDAKKNENEEKNKTSNSDETPTKINSVKPTSSITKDIILGVLDCAKSSRETKNNSQLNNDEKLENKNESEAEPSKLLENCSIKDSKSSEKDENEKATREVNKIETKSEDSSEIKLENVQEKKSVEKSEDDTKIDTKPVTSVPSKLFSIVPYDEDSTSSSQMDVESDNAKQENEVSVVNESSIVETQSDESASLASKNDEKNDLNETENVAEHQKETSNEEVDEAMERSNKDESINTPKDVDEPTEVLKPLAESSVEVIKESSVENERKETLNETEITQKETETNFNESEETKYEPEVSQKADTEGESSSEKEVKFDSKEPEKCQEVTEFVNTKDCSETVTENAAKSTSENEITIDETFKSSQQQEISTEISEAANTSVPKVEFQVDEKKISETSEVDESLKDDKSLKIDDSNEISNSFDYKNFEPQKTENASKEVSELKDNNKDTSNSDKLKKVLNVGIEKTTEQNVEVLRFKAKSSPSEAPVELEFVSKQPEAENQALKETIKEKQKPYEEVLKPNALPIEESSVNDGAIEEKLSLTEIKVKSLVVNSSNDQQKSEKGDSISEEVVSHTQDVYFKDHQDIAKTSNDVSEIHEILPDAQKIVPEIQTEVCEDQNIVSEARENLSATQKILPQTEDLPETSKVNFEPLSAASKTPQSIQEPEKPSKTEPVEHSENDDVQTCDQEQNYSKIFEKSTIENEQKDFDADSTLINARGDCESLKQKIIEKPSELIQKTDRQNDDVQNDAASDGFQTTTLTSEIIRPTERFLEPNDDEKLKPSKSKDGEFSFDIVKQTEFEEKKAEKEVQPEISVAKTSEEFDDVESPEDFTEFAGDNDSSGEESDHSKNEVQSISVEHAKVKVASIQSVESPDIIALGSQNISIEPSAEISENKNCVISAEIESNKPETKHDKMESNDIVPPKTSQEKELTLKREQSIETIVKNEEEKPEKLVEKFSKPPATRKRKISERKSMSESDSEGNNVIDSTVSHENTSEDEEVVQKKKPRMRGKTLSPRKMPARRAATKKTTEEEKEVDKKTVEEPSKITPEIKDKESKETLQSLKFDYDGSEDIAAKVAAIKTMICKDPKKETTSEMSDDEALDRKSSSKRGRKTKRGRIGKSHDAGSSSDEDPLKLSSKTESKKIKPSNETPATRKKRETGLLKYIDKSLVIDTTDETPVRQSRRIAQQKIREETERRQVEEKMLKQMKALADRKKKSGEGSDEEEAYEEEEEQKDSSEEDETFKESKKKKKSKIPAADKQWQTSSSHSEHSESEDYMEHVPSDPGSPLFKSDHEFSPESDDDDAVQVQPLKRARTAKKVEAVASSDEEEDINPKHACQVCHKTDSPEWILLCDECDCGYHCSCLKPIIFLIPSGNWFCPLCCHKKLIVNLSDQLSQLDTLMYNIETAELKKQRQKLAEITEQNILQERRKIRAERASKSKEKTPESKDSSGSGSDSDDSSDDEPLKYKLRKRNSTAAPSYRFNEYDDLINSAIKRDLDDVKGAGNLGRGKDISTIIDADNEEKQEQGDENNENEGEEEKELNPTKEDDGESSGSDVIRPKKISKKKKKKLNNLDVSSAEERGSDEDFKGSSSSDSEVDEEDLSMSSVSESSLDLPSKKKKGRNTRTLRNREKRTDRRFINDNSDDSDDEPLIKAKRSRKKDSDEEEFDLNDDEDDEGSLAEEIDSEDLCDDTETDSSSEGNWPKKKKKRVASYDTKPRKAPKKKDENEDKAFRAGISKKKVLKKSDNESEGSASDNDKGKRKTRGKKLLYLIEDDLDSDESDGIKPGVKRPETPPEEREMFFKKQEEIKRMLAAKDTEAAKKLAAPTIEPIHIAMEKPKSPPLPFSNEPASLSTIPKNVIESAKALDTDYNRIVKPIAFGSHSKGSEGSLQSNDMNEEELARMMEEEDFAQHQLKLAGEAIARKKLLELEAKEEEFAAYSKVNREKEFPVVAESKKRSRKPKSAEKQSEEFTNFSKALSNPQGPPPNLTSAPIPPLISSNPSQLPPRPLMQQQPPPSLIANMMQHPHHLQPHVPTSVSMMNERPSVLSTFMSRPDMHPQHQKIHQPIPPDVFNSKMPSQQYDESEEKKKGRRKKFTPLRTDLPEGNISKLAKLDPPSVIQSAPNPAERVEDKHKVPRPDLPKLAVAAPPQIFNPATNPTPSVITRLLQPQQRPGPYPQGFSEVGAENPNIRMYPSQEDIKNMSPSKAQARGPSMPQGPPTSLGNLPPTSFSDHPAFGPRGIHPLYRGPTPYGIPPHARLPPYPFHHLHPGNLRPGEYSAPYNIPPQFSYYAPPAHSRQPPQTSAIPLNHGAPQHVAGNEEISNSIRNANNPQEPGETGGSSEFGGLINFFNSQQELD